ncbi:hypothetical protein D7T59_05500 [Stenotrophomonas maltophilia]|nr:hypothetical protein [Stenotrophomonas maltophilia]MBA0344157.1 hypothetical protein [Stenotrophomonas maltophilia]MBA0518874.1 hypothetical protein [Stenotrophomonas maltophilia]
MGLDVIVRSWLNDDLIRLGMLREHEAQRHPNSYQLLIVVALIRWVGTTLNIFQRHEFSSLQVCARYVVR